MKLRRESRSTRLLEAAGWRFFPAGDQPANIRLESSVTIQTSDLDALGNDFEQISRGFIDFLLLDARGFPFIVLEAKAENRDPLVGKEQSRRYARSLNCRFVLLSNGNLHYFWDLERGNPYLITSFPTPDSAAGYQKVTPIPQRLLDDKCGRTISCSPNGPPMLARRPGRMRTNVPASSGATGYAFCVLIN